MLGSTWSEVFQRGGQDGKEATHSGADHHCTAGGSGRSGPRRSAIVHMLESAGGTLRVHPGDASSFFRLLPEPEAAWVIEADADAIFDDPQFVRRTEPPP